MILCAGKSLIDMVPQDGAFRPMPGGSVYNTAVALGRLGAPAGYFWPISYDMFGAAIMGPLVQAGVDVSLCPRSARLTTLAFVTLSGGEAHYSFYDDNSAGRMLGADDLPDLPGAVAALFVGGISLAAEPCGTAMAALVRRHHRDRVVMIDPNIRPNVIENPDAYRERTEALCAMADIVKLSVDDAAWLFPDLAPRDAAARIATRGPQIVLLSEGAQGATAFWPGGMISERARPVPVADSIGAGDSVNAGFLAALWAQGLLTKPALRQIEAEALAGALAHAMRVAAITVSRPGANPPWAHELAP